MKYQRDLAWEQGIQFDTENFINLWNSALTMKDGTEERPNFISDMK